MSSIYLAQPIINSTQVVVDDRSPLIVYDGPWTLGGLPGYEYSGTTHAIEKPGSFRFAVFATSIAIYGTLGTSVPSCQASYAIDGLVMASNLQPTVNLPGQISPMFGTQLFTSPQLTADFHEVTVNIGPCSNDYSNYLFDYIVYQPA